MEILGIGPLELLFIILLAVIIFGPKDMEKAGRTVGRTLYKLINSDTWRSINQASRKLKTLPTDLMRSARLEDLDKENTPGVTPSTAWKEEPRILPGPPPAAQPPSAGHADAAAGNEEKDA